MPHHNRRGDDLDMLADRSQLDAMKGALQSAGKTFEIKVYAGAPHGFHADYRASYRKEAAEDDVKLQSWKQTVAWFKKYKVLS